jgi:RNA polymerase sigma-70 factor (ECF subfamily)
MKVPAKRPPGDQGSAEERFEGVYRAYRDALYAYALRRVPQDVAQDIVAETFAIAWRRFDRVPAEPAGWLFATARNVMLGRRRREQRQNALGARLTRRLAHEQPLDGRQEIAPVLAALAELAEPDREVLLLSAWEGLGSREGATVLGCSSAAFRLRLHRARRRLQKRLATENEALADERGCYRPISARRSPDAP